MKETIVESIPIPSRATLSTRRFNICNNAVIHSRGEIFSARTIGHDLGSITSTKATKTSLYAIGRKILRALKNDLTLTIYYFQTYK